MAGKPLVVKIQGDDSDLRRALKNASDGVKGFGKTVGRVGAKAAGAFAATGAAVGVASVTAFAGFEKSMNEVMTLLPGAGEEVFDDLSSQVKDFSRQFGVLPAEVIPSLYQALSAGVPKDDVFSFMETAQMAAAGGVTDLETAVDGISSVMNAYGDQVSGATEVSDLMMVAVREGKTTFEEMASSMFQVAPIAASLGVPFRDVTTSIANLTALGVPTSVAAVQMKAALAELAKEGSAADVAFRDLTGMGLTQFLEEEGNFASALGIMKDGADEMGVSVLDMFGSIEAGQAVLALTQDGTESYMETLTEMGGSAGATQGAFETMDRGLAVVFDKIKANVNVLAIEIGERLAPLVMTAAGKIQDAFGKVRPVVQDLVDRFKAFLQTEEFQRFRDIVVGAFNDVREALTTAFEAIKKWVDENPHAVLAALAVVIGIALVGAVWALLAAVGALFSPVVLIVAALAALAAGAVYAYENFEGFREVVDNVRAWAVDTLWPAMQQVAEGIVVAFGYLKDYAVETLWPALQTAFEGIITAALAVKDFAVETLWPALQTAFEGIVTALGWVKDFAVDTLWPALQVAFDGIITAARAVGSFISDTLWPLLQTAWDGILTGAEAVGNGVMAVAGFFRDNILPIIVAFWESIATQIGNFWTILVGLYDLVKALFSGDFAAVWDAFSDVIGGVLDGAVELFINLPSRLLGAASSLGSQLAEWAGTAMGLLLDAIKDNADDVVLAFMGIPLRLFNALSGGLTLLVNAGKDIVGSLLDGLVDGLGSAVGFVADFAKGLAQAVISFFNDNVIDYINDKIPDKIELRFAPDINLPDNPLPRIPNLARGGIATSSTLARIGEGGEAEAIVPLSRASEFGFGGGNTINLTVNAGMGTDPVQVGREIISILKQWERHNGSIPLTTSAA